MKSNSDENVSGRNGADRAFVTKRLSLLIGTASQYQLSLLFFETGGQEEQQMYPEAVNFLSSGESKLPDQKRRPPSPYGKSAPPRLLECPESLFFLVSGVIVFLQELLGFFVPLLRGPQVPLGRLLLVLRYAPALKEAVTQALLR